MSNLEQKQKEISAEGQAKQDKKEEGNAKLPQQQENIKQPANTTHPIVDEEDRLLEQDSSLQKAPQNVEQKNINQSSITKADEKQDNKHKVSEQDNSIIKVKDEKQMQEQPKTEDNQHKGGEQINQDKSKMEQKHEQPKIEDSKHKVDEQVHPSQSNIKINEDKQKQQQSKIEDIKHKEGEQVHQDNSKIEMNEKQKHEQPKIEESKQHEKSNIKINEDKQKQEQSKIEDNKTKTLEQSHTDATNIKGKEEKQKQEQNKTEDNKNKAGEQINQDKAAIKGDGTSVPNSQVTSSINQPQLEIKSELKMEQPKQEQQHKKDLIPGNANQQSDIKQKEKTQEEKLELDNVNHSDIKDLKDNKEQIKNNDKKTVETTEQEIQHKPSVSNQEKPKQKQEGEQIEKKLDQKQEQKQQVNENNQKSELKSDGKQEISKQGENKEKQDDSKEKIQIDLENQNVSVDKSESVESNKDNKQEDNEEKKDISKQDGSEDQQQNDPKSSQKSKSIISFLVNSPVKILNHSENQYQSFLTGLKEKTQKKKEEQQNEKLKQDQQKQIEDLNQKDEFNQNENEELKDEVKVIQINKPGRQMVVVQRKVAEIPKRPATFKLKQLEKSFFQQVPKDHVYVKSFVEKEIDKEAKLREAARKQRELQQQLMEINSEIIKMRQDAKPGNDEVSPSPKKQKIIAKVRQNNQVKAMIEISDNKEAKEQALALVRKLNKEKRQREMIEQKKLEKNKSKFRVESVMTIEKNEEEAIIRERLRQEETIRRIKQHDLQKTENQNKQQASKEFVRNLNSKGQSVGSISDIYIHQVKQIEKESEEKILKLNQETLTPFLDHKKQALENLRSFKQKTTEEVEEENQPSTERNPRQISQDQLDDMQEGSQKQSVMYKEDPNNNQSTKKRLNQKEDNRYKLSKSPLKKVQYGSIFMERVIEDDKEVKVKGKIIAEEKKQLYEKRMLYAKTVKHKYTPKAILNNYNFYQDAMYLKEQMKIKDIEEQQPNIGNSQQQASEEYQKYEREPNNYIEANRAWKIHNKVIVQNDYPQSEQVRRLQF